MSSVDVRLKVIQKDQAFYLGIEIINKKYIHEIQKLCKYDHSLKLYKTGVDQYPKFFNNANFKIERLPVQFEKCKPLPRNVSLQEELNFQQNENILHLLKNPKNVHNFQWLTCKCLLQSKKIMLSDDMGLGKTIQTIASICLLDKWPVLISTPASLLDNWYNEVMKWTNIGQQNILKIRKGTDLDKILPDLKLGMKKIILATVDLSARNSSKFLKKFKFGILDEAHSVKNNGTIRYKGMKVILRHCEYTILISGTPITGKIEELFTQLNICRPDYIKDKNQFATRYAYVREFRNPAGYSTKIYTGSKNEDELYYVLRDVMIRRTKDDLLELEAKNRTCVIREIDPLLLQTCTTILDQMKSKSKKQSEDEVIKDAMANKGDLNKLWLQLYRATSLAKVQFVKDYLQELIEVYNECNDFPVEGVTCPVNGILFFCHHQAMLREIESFCQFLNTDYILIDGDTKTDKRQALVDKFQNDSTIPIALLSIKACNTGLTLTKASHVVFGEMTWSWSDMAQAEDRCHRIGQLNQVESIVLIGKGTIDKQLWNLLNRKQNIVSQCMDGKRSKVDAEYTGIVNELKAEKIPKVPKLIPGQSKLNFSNSETIQNLVTNEEDDWLDVEVNENDLIRAQKIAMENVKNAEESWLDVDINENDYQMALQKNKRQMEDESWLDVDINENDYQMALEKNKRQKK
eukprot:NODE_674_length_5333_cov_0.595338.p1 type:complete len:689 gc:universal NODE_674_length_5333_cov_0.595338:4102-2036(-)